MPTGNTEYCYQFDIPSDVIDKAKTDLSKKYGDGAPLVKGGCTKIGYLSRRRNEEYPIPGTAVEVRVEWFSNGTPTKSLQNLQLIQTASPKVLILLI